MKLWKGNGIVYCVDFSDGFVGVSKVIKWCTLNMHSVLCVLGNKAV